ncbi:HEAT repeat domain-containing protein [bacterium]|nr:HEAT repeat domain-containing protein [bacterium]
MSSKRRRVIACAAVALLLALLTWRIAEPRVYVWLMWINRKGPEGEAHGRWAAERLASCGPRAIPAILSALRRESPFVRGYAYLPHALAQIGDVAHQALKGSIETEADPPAKSYLIGALLSGFADLTFVDAWLDDYFGGRLSSWHAVHMEPRLRELLGPTMPPLTVDGEPNEQFRIWWNARGKGVR